MSGQLTNIKERNFWRPAAFTLILLGTLTSVLLLSQFFSSVSCSSSNGSLCSLLFGSGCDKIHMNPVGKLGIPLGGWGVVHFIMTGTLLTLSLKLGESFLYEGILLSLGLCSVATVVGIYLSWLMLSGYTPFCIFCFMVHCINPLLIPVIQKSSGRSWEELAHAFKSMKSPLSEISENQSLLLRWKMTGITTACLTGLITFQWVLIQTERNTQTKHVSVEPDQKITQIETTSEENIHLVHRDIIHKNR